MRLIYLAERKGLPKLDAQRSALLAAGITEAELAEAYLDRKVRPDEVAQRDYVPGACRPGDEVWIARPAVIATTEDVALRFVAAIARHGAVLCIASTGERYSAPAEAREGIDAGLRLVAAIRADERAAVMERARKGRHGKAGGRQPIAPAKLEKAKALWLNHDISGDEAAERTGISKRTLARYFGKRNTPAFGRALNMKRGKA